MRVTNVPPVVVSVGDRQVSLSSPGRALLLVIGGRTADSITTLYGLQSAGVYERNPVARLVFDQLGQVLGLVVGNLLALALLVVGVEIAVTACRDGAVPECRIRLLRVGSYLSFAAVSFLAAIYNLHVLAGA